MHEGAAHLPRQREIAEPLEAKFSVYNVAALVVTRGKAGPPEYNDQLLTDPTIGRLRELISVVADETVPNGSGSVRARLSDGREIKIDVEHALGTIGHPLDDETLRSKLFDAAGDVFDADRIAEIADAIEQMAGCDDVSRILQLVTK
jgi:2-methylcitrate dehydratase PrpD